MIKIANEIETSDEENEADESNGQLADDLMTIGSLSEGESF